ILPFAENFKKFAAVSAVVILAGFVSMGVFASQGKGALNYGLDFKGGTSMSVTFPDELNEKLNQRLEKTVADTLSLTAEIVQVTGENTYIIKTIELSQEQRAELTNVLIAEYGVDESLIQTENISGKVSGEMRSAAIKAVIIATVCMLIYIWIRFKNFNFAASAVSALVHDVLVVLTVYAVGRIAVGNTFIACMLTIVGYSINATIVIFDRIRENLAQNAENDVPMSLVELVNRSVTETFSRSVNSSLTTLTMVVMLAIFGVDTIREFAVPLLVGIVAGGWSSVCITGGLWYLLEKKKSL
ncbi:MAG: protein translocase subunit SecF, partial [Lachnospiraceae bacterium]|nr:protein translocase subunit SecF [Lachnospiraceae bacterium]